MALVTAIAPAIGRLVDPVVGTLTSIGSSFSLSSLACAFGVAYATIVWRRRSKGRDARPRAVLRALLPGRLARLPSCRADALYFLFNTMVYGLLLGWTVLSYKWISLALPAELTALFGAPAPSRLSPLVAGASMTLVGFLGYELGYWIDHRLSHEIPALWEIHKVHHTAEVLTPLSVWRVHPLETAKFLNILAISVASSKALFGWATGIEASPFALGGNNLLLVLFVHAYVHLQHSSVWIAFPGWLGRVFMSPAQHQIHHSRDPAHFNCNLGSCLSVFDTLFGTVRVATMAPEKLRFGVEGEGAQAHAAYGLFVAPVVRAFAALAPVRHLANPAARSSQAGQAPQP